MGELHGDSMTSIIRWLSVSDRKTLEWLRSRKLLPCVRLHVQCLKGIAGHMYEDDENAPQ